MKTDLIEKYAPILCGSTPPVVRDPRLLMDASGDVKIYYAPFEYINPSARIVLVGITPCPTQMVNANNEARRALHAGKSSTEAIHAAKSVGAFSGEPLRSNLINQLNHWGFHKWLGLTDSANLFSTSRHLVQTTSLLRYPVFVKDDDYGRSEQPALPPGLRHRGAGLASLSSRISPVQGGFWRVSPPYGRTAPVVGNKRRRAIHRFDSANSVSTCAAFFARPR